MGGLAELLLGKDNPIAQWANANSGRLGAVGAGLGSGTDFGSGLASAARLMPQGRQIDDAYATAQKEEQQRQDNLNKTIQYLRATQPDLADAVETGLPIADAWNEALKRRTEAQKAPDQQALINTANGIYDPNARQWITNPNAPAAGTTDPKDAFQMEKDLSAQYTGSEPVKTYQDVRNGFERVRTSAVADSGAGDVGVVYGFMKMLDPGSVVREGEFATAEQTAGIPQQIVGLYNKLISGERLTPEQRQQFITAAEKLYAESASNLSSQNTMFSDRAKRWQVNPGAFIISPEQYDPLQIATQPAAGAPASPADPLGLR